MTTTISKVAYKAVWDSSNLAKGLMGTRAMFMEQKKILQSMQQPVDRYTQAQQNLANMLAKFPDLQKHKLQLEQRIEKQYLQEEAALRKLTGSEKVRLWQLMSQDEKAMARKAGAQRREEAQRRDAEQKEKEHRKRLEMIRRNSEEMELARIKRMQAARTESIRRMGLMAGTGASRNDWMTSGGGGSAFGGAAAGAGLARGAGAAALAYGGYRATTGAMGVLSQGQDAYRELERVESALNVFSGSLATSRDLLAQIRVLSAETGVSFAGLSQGAKTLMLRDVDAKQSVEMMRKIAIVTGGEVDSMKSMALAMGQINQAGKLMGQELIQLVNAGWTPLEEIVKKTGIPMSEMRKEMEAGRISYEMVSDALDAAVSAGGRYYGFLESLEGTTARETDRAAAAWEEASARIGQALKPITTLWQQFQGALAKDLGQLASVFIDKAPVTPDDPKAAAAAKRVADAAARRKALIDRENASFADQAERARSQQEFSSTGLDGMRAELAKEMMTKEQASSFDRMFNLLTDFNKERATAELAAYGAKADISSLLDEQTRKEFQQLDIQFQKVEAEKQRAELIEKSQSKMNSYLGKEQQKIASLVDLEMGRQLGTIGMSDYNRATSELFRDNTLRSGNLASNMTVGSQEAYSFMAGVQDRSAREAAARHREQKELQKALIEATKQVKAAIEALEPVGVAG